MAVLMATRRRLLEEDPEIEADERLYGDMLDGESGNAMGIIDAMLRAAIHANDMKAAAHTRSEILADRAERYANREATIRGAVFAAMDTLGLKRRELPDVTASIKAGTQSLAITDELAVPDNYWRITRTLDKAAIKAALKAGDTVPGAELSNGLPSLQIRSK